MTTLKQQIDSMIRNEEDWIPDPVGIDQSKYEVVNLLGEAWLVLHNDQCDIQQMTKVRQITE